ncbi:MAG TPA: molybdopterin molybdotransferase MoeA [Verrucomicrobiae bacterium]|nr:molybdopterin molybdotransferase MoeA [Verrucomicrobiae bacterium]
MISLAQARALIAEKITPLPAQPASLRMEHGRILREDICADADMPAFDRSAMDGYAIGLGDDSKQFRIVGEIQPGVVPQFKVNRGECARIFTGAHIPEGASQVLMQENVRVENGIIIPSKPGQIPHIRKRGEDARKGDLLLRSGTRLGAGELSLLASLGVVEPKVSVPVRVAHFVTGNELVEPSVTPGPGQIRDSNSTLVAALIRQFGGEISRQENVVDDFNLLLEQVRAGGDNFDLLLMSGGASVGDYDFGKKLLGALGFQIHFEQINLRPGKPLVFATRENQAAFILPGNPVSHFVTMQVAVRLALQRFAGAEAAWPLVNIRLAENFNHRPDPRETFWPARLEIQNGELVVRALRWQSSGDVTGLTGANALLQLGGNVSPPKAGETVPVLMLEVP